MRDNLPLVSWVLLRGRCRDCGASIPWRYPAVELASALLVTFCIYRFGVGITGVGLAIFALLLLALGITDAEMFLLPNALTLSGLMSGVLFQIAVSAETAQHRVGEGTGQVLAAVLPAVLRGVLSAIVIGGTLLLFASVYQLLRKRTGMGAGDIKLGAMLGAWLGWKLGLVTLFLAIMAGAVAGIVVVISETGRKEKGQEEIMALRLPFGSFLCAAALLVVFVGPAMLKWYLHLMR